MRRRRLWSAVLGILLSITAALVFAAWPGTSTFTVSTETTYVTEPLDKHGYVDYVTALNQRIGKGITPQTNANVLIWQALGPRPEGGTLPAEYFQWLGIESPPEEGEYFVSWQDYRKRLLKIDKGFHRNEDHDLPVDLPSSPWNAKDEPELATWLEQNRKPLALLVEATRRQEYFNPLVPKRTEDWSPGLLAAPLSSVAKCRELASALICRAMLSVADGNVDDAWQDLLACHRLGRLMTRGGATLVEFLVGVAIEGVAEKGDVQFLGHAKLTSKQVSAYLENLRRLLRIPGLADKIDLGERFMLLDVTMMTARYGPGIVGGLGSGKSTPPEANRFTSRLFTRSINWDPALRNANRWIDRYVGALRIEDRNTRVPELASLNQDIKVLKGQVAATGWLEKQFMGPNSRGELIGNVLIGLLTPGFEKLQNSAERIEQQQRNLHVAFALAAYRQDHGRYPAKLDELAPKYLEIIPDDLFSGEALIYRLEDDGYLLYSVGVNGIDDDGRGYDDQPPGDDLSIRMPVPAPKSEK
jgi:hypothetical protein